MEGIPNKDIVPVVDIDMNLLEEQLLLATSRVFTHKQKEKTFTRMREQLLDSVPVVQLTIPSDSSVYLDQISRNVEKCFNILNAPDELPASQISNERSDCDAGNHALVTRWKTSLRQRKSTGSPSSATKSPSSNSVLNTVSTIANNFGKQSSNSLNFSIELPQIKYSEKRVRFSLDGGEINMQQNVDAILKKIVPQQNVDFQHVDHSENSTVATQRMDDLPSDVGFSELNGHVLNDPDIPDYPALHAPVALETVFPISTTHNMFINSQDLNNNDSCTSNSKIRAMESIAPKVDAPIKETPKRRGRKPGSKNRPKAKKVNGKEMQKSQIAKYVETFSSENQMNMLTESVNASAMSQDITMTTHNSGQFSPIYALSQPLFYITNEGLIQISYSGLTVPDKNNSENIVTSDKKKVGDNIMDAADDTLVFAHNAPPSDQKSVKALDLSCNQPTESTPYSENSNLPLNLSSRSDIDIVAAVPMTVEETDDNFIQRIAQVSAIDVEPMNTLAESENEFERQRTAVYEQMLNLSGQTALNMPSLEPAPHYGPEITFVQELPKETFSHLNDINAADNVPYNQLLDEQNSYEILSVVAPLADLNQVELDAAEFDATEFNTPELNAFDFNSVDLNAAQLNASVFDFNAVELNLADINTHGLDASYINADEFNAAEVNESEAMQAQFVGQYECVNNQMNYTQRENKDEQHYLNYATCSPLLEVLAGPSQMSREENCIAEVIHNEELVAEAQAVKIDEAKMRPGPSMALTFELGSEMNASDDDIDIISLDTSYLGSEDEESAETTPNETATAELASVVYKQVPPCTDNNTVKNVNLTPSRALYGRFKIPKLSLQKVAQMTLQNSHNSCDVVLKTSPNKGVYSSRKRPYETYSPEIKQPNDDEMPQNSDTDEKSLQVRQQQHLAKLFRLRCPSDLLVNDTSNLPYELINVDLLPRALHMLSPEELERAYFFMYNHAVLFHKYFHVFCEVYTVHSNYIKLLNMVYDCQRYANGAKFLYKIYHCLVNCGMGKITTCRQMLSCMLCYSHKTIDVFVDLIMKADCASFCDEILKFVHERKYRLSVSVLTKMAQMVLGSNNITVTQTFFQCIVALNSAEFSALKNSKVIMRVLKRIQNKNLLIEQKNIPQ